MLNMTAPPVDRRTLFITALEGIRIPEGLGDGIELPFQLRLTNDWRVIKRLTSENFRASIGSLETATLLRAPAVLYSVTDTPPVNDSLVDHVDERLRVCRTFLIGLWFHKDNSVDHQLGFAAYPHLDNEAVISSNYVAARFSSRSGGDTITEFTRKDLEWVSSFVDKYVEGMGVEPRGSIEAINMTRVERALYFLQAARGSHTLGLKISYYCTCFEALFSTSSTELTHKLGERVASFLAASPRERLTLYRDVKQAYMIRSKVVHGDQLKDRDLRLALNLSDLCDDAVRKILRTIFESDEMTAIFKSKSEVLEDFLLAVTFGESPVKLAAT
jgi:hypothetical protein